MQGIRLVAAGKLKERFLISAQNEYLKRISRFTPLEIRELAEERLPENPSRSEIEAALKREAALIRGEIPSGSVTAALCKEGKMYDSEGFSELLTGDMRGRLVFVIGSSFGLDEGFKGEAPLRISMSEMTFPHHLARIMLLEQIYRGFMIDTGGRYHK